MTEATPIRLLEGLRIIESSMLGPAAITVHLADLGADVIKVEPPTGDYVRDMTWPIVNGVSLMHLHINRGKRSIALDLRTEAGINTYLELVAKADVVVEAMRPGALAKRGLTWERLQEANPKIVFCTISGYGATGPYQDLPSHGVAYDTWAGLVQPAVDEDGMTYIPEHPSMGIHAGPLLGAFSILAAVMHAQKTGTAVRMELAQSDAAAYMDWYRIESWKAYERPESEVTGNKSDNYERRAPGTAGMKHGVRYQIYASKDGHVLFMASEQEFWKNFCAGVDRMDLFERWPGAKYADHAPGNREMQRELTAIFATKTSAEWIQFGSDQNTAIAPVNTPKNIVDDPQFQDRFHWVGAEQLDADQLLLPLNLIDGTMPIPERAPTVAEHRDEVLSEVLGLSAEAIAERASAGAFGTPA